jgi:Uma2 family endonuclease
MATRPNRPRWSYAEFARLPDDGNRYEVIGGELQVTPAPGTLHQRVLATLTARLTRFVEESELGWVLPGPVDVLFAEGDYLEPDLVFVRRERKGVISDRGIEAAPDLVVEIVSDSTAARDRGVKRERYAHFGVPRYWIVDPALAVVEVYDLQKDPERPERHADVLTWRPVPGGPILSLRVPELLRGFD